MRAVLILVTFRRKDDDVRLGDSTAVTGLKPMYDVYGSVDVDSMYDQHLYDDEYDDTYDVSNVGAHDDDSVDDLLTLCRSGIPTRLRLVILRRPDPIKPCNVTQVRPDYTL